MRILLFLVFASLNFAFAASTQEKIKSSKNSLRSAEAMSQQLNKKLDDLAGDIVGGEQKLKAIGADIANLKQQISLLESNATSATGELEKLNAQNKELIQAQKELEQNIIAIIAEDLSFDLLLEQNETTQSEDSIIVSHILNKLNGVMKEDFKRLSKNYEDTITQINSQSNKINQINSSLKNYKRKQSDLLALENKQKSTINDLKRDKEIYTKKLAKLQSQQEELQKTLEQLAIVQKGYVIGRVKDDLTFEVTQKNYHIDPLELISLK